MPIAKVGDINLYYEIHGDGEPLLLIMGYGSNCGHWFVIRDRLAKEHQLIMFDNRGTGRSDKPDIPYTSEMMTGDITGLLDAIGIGATNVFGVSMGGMIAQEFVLNYPQRVKKLVLGCTSCGGPNAAGSTPEATAFLFDPERARLSNEEKAYSTIPWLWNKDFIDKHPEAVKRYVVTTTEHPTPPHAYICQGNFIMTFNSYDRLQEIKAPTLVICGDQDRLIPYENSRILASRIPGSELVILENAGHGFISDSADESSKVILQFLKRH
jgi:pimeloyl-ACP methyl ester carboxylesterase